jgi:hypothetical protein
MTTELKPGTPEYDEAYQKEMQRLEAEAKPGDKKDAKDDATNTSEVKDEAKAAAKTDEAKTETLEELKTRLDEEQKARERLEKSLKDTQRWAHQNAGMVKKLQKEAEDRKRQETAPEMLKANPGLEDAIKHVAGTNDNAKPEPKDEWLASVSKAIPDIETHLGDQAFFAKARARQQELGPDWDDPFVAIRELTELKVAHLSEKRTQAAVEAARKDFESKSKKRNAMEVPGGSGGKDAPKTDDGAKRYQTMSKEEFDKERARVMGY